MKIDLSVPLRILTDVLFRNLGLKLLALVMTAVLFVSTRDDVTRSFEVPLRVIPDPDRVLLTQLPETIQVRVRGPWTRLNRLQDYDFEAARFDLRDAAPGPLRIDEGVIVMPPGVVFSKIEYDHVDLRFEPVVTNRVRVEATTRGQPDPDYERVKIEVDPPKLEVRGGKSEVQQIQILTTSAVDISGAKADVAARAEVIRPDANVTIAGAEVEMPRVDVFVKIEPIIETRDQMVTIPVPEDVDPAGKIPKTYTVQLTGPLPQFRVLKQQGISFPVVAEVAPLDERTADGLRAVELRFGWAESVPESVREALTLDHAVVRFEVPAAPNPGATPVEEPI